MNYVGKSLCFIKSNLLRNLIFLHFSKIQTSLIAGIIIECTSAYLFQQGQVQMSVGMPVGKNSKLMQNTNQIIKNVAILSITRSNRQQHFLIINLTQLIRLNTFSKFKATTGEGLGYKCLCLVSSSCKMLDPYMEQLHLVTVMFTNLYQQSY